MSQSTKKTKTIAFRLTDEEYKQIEEAAAATDQTQTSGAEYIPGEDVMRFGRTAFSHAGFTIDARLVHGTKATG